MIILCGLTLPGYCQIFSLQERLRYEAESMEVTIIRDKWGIPHIYGKTDAAVVFGLMYAECQEDFSRVEKNYLEVLGRQAEAYGEGYLYNDVMMRLIYDSVQAEADYTKSPDWMHKLLDAFADGVNYYLYKHSETKPLLLKRFEPWYALMFTDGSVSATSIGGLRPEEIRNFYNSNSPSAEMMAPPNRPQGLSAVERMVLSDRGMSGPEGDEAPKGGPGQREKQEREGVPVEWTDKPEPGAESGGLQKGDQGAGRQDWEPGTDDRERGSNGFALAGFRTASGNTELYINPHVPFYFRMEVQLVSDEGLNTYGAVTWGQFFVYQGFNAHCGWMHTSSMAAVDDL